MGGGSKTGAPTPLVVALWPHMESWVAERPLGTPLAPTWTYMLLAAEGGGGVVIGRTLGTFCGADAAADGGRG